MTVALGVDVGGTKIAAGVVDEDGTLLSEKRVGSPARDREGIIEAIRTVVSALRHEHEVDCVGLAVAGFVDRGRSKVVYAPNLAWHDVALREELEKSLGTHVVVENDANAAAWGEFQYGAGRDSDNLLLVTVGTGVGAGVVLDGELVRGGFGMAMEVGHLRFLPGGHQCGCGLEGCWEQYASGTALVRTTREAAVHDPRAAPLLERSGGDPSQITGPMVTSEAMEGDPFCVGMLHQLGRRLGEGLAMLSTVLDPGLMVLGGGVAEAGDLLLGPVRVTYRDNLSAGDHRPIADIVTARLGNLAGVIGAADLARR